MILLLRDFQYFQVADVPLGIVGEREDELWVVVGEEASELDNLVDLRGLHGGQGFVTVGRDLAFELRVAKALLNGDSLRFALFNLGLTTW